MVLCQMFINWYFSLDTAYGKSKIDGNWYYYDDSNVTQTNEEAVCTKAAYVLFYQRRWGRAGDKVTLLTLGYFRPQSKSKRNIPSAAGSSETDNEATTSSLNHNGNLVNGEPVTNGVSEEEMEIN